MVMAFMMLSGPVFGDVEAQSVFVRQVEIIGNKKTKSALIYREMDFHQYDSLALGSLSERLEKNEKLLMNTGLFNSVEINLKNWDEDSKSVDLTVTVVESWYIFPLPIFNLADRNLNVWWKEHNASLKRVNYGLRFVYVNFTGNKDNLKLTLQGGYTRRVLLQYERPYINRKKTIGITGRYFFDHRREFAYETIDNKQTFYQNPEKINFKSRKAIVSMHYRQRVEASHEVLIKYEHNRVAEEVLDLNDRFFNGKATQEYFEIDYFFRRERRDSRFYPTSGNYLEVQSRKVGIGIFSDVDKFYTAGRYYHYFDISNRFKLESRFSAQREWTQNAHPYYGLDALGYGEDYIRGYELYVIDGTDFLLTRNSFKIKVFDQVYDLKKKMPVQSYRIFPITLYFTINADLGKSYNKLFNQDNPLNNRWLFGKGIGLDLVLYYKYAFQVEYSINHLNEKGIFLHIRSEF